MKHDLGDYESNVTSSDLGIKVDNKYIVHHFPSYLGSRRDHSSKFLAYIDGIKRTIFGAWEVTIEYPDGKIVRW